MSSPTPTKRLTAARFAGVELLEGAFTDFSDAHDVSDGDGARPPSTGPHVVLLQESLLAMGYELGHGADGVYGPETKAAVLRLQVDAGHPLMPGHAWEHIGGIAGPNTMAHFDMFDPGGTVGDPLPPRSGIAARAVQFAESPDNPFSGLDAATTPPSLTLGDRTRRRVATTVEPAHGDVEFVTSNPAVATVGYIAEGIVVGGQGAGSATIHARSGAQTIGELTVTVKEMRREVVNFFFAAGTARLHEQATLLTLRLNRVWRRQANVLFGLGAVRDVTLADASPETLDALAVRGQFNVFCVAGAADACAPNPAVFVLPDNDCADAMALPHASGHYLGARHSRSGLMAACGGGSDRRRVDKALADLVNP